MKSVLNTVGEPGSIRYDLYDDDIYDWTTEEISEAEAELETNEDVYFRIQHFFGSIPFPKRDRTIVAAKCLPPPPKIKTPAEIMLAAINEAMKSLNRQVEREIWK